MDNWRSLTTRGRLISQNACDKKDELIRINYVTTFLVTIQFNLSIFIAPSSMPEASPAAEQP